MFCPVCGKTRTGCRAASLAEPVPRRAANFLRQWEKTTVSPAEFAQLVQFLRENLGLAPNRRICPGTSIGTPYILRRRYVPRWNVYICVDDIYFSDTAKQTIEAINASGILFYPVENRHRQPSGIWLGVVDGYASLPLIDTGIWIQCEGCDRWFPSEVQGDYVRYALGWKQVEAADFMYLEGAELVIVSERVYELLAELDHNCSSCFVPLSEWRQRVTPLTPEELFEADKMFEELKQSLVPPPLPSPKPRRQGRR
jgi:hypothetical protein